jgi:hypothetical protein
MSNPEYRRKDNQRLQGRLEIRLAEVGCGGNPERTMPRRFWTYAAAVCLLLAGTGCGSSYQLAKTVGALSVLPEDRVFPTKPKFTVQPVTVADGEGIDFEAVYYLDNRSIPGVSIDGGNYFRFWPDGRVMERCAGRKPSTEDADQFLGAWLGYYQVNEGKLVLEFFAPEPVKYRWNYWKLEAVLQGDQIRLQRGERNRKSETKNRVYVRVPLKGMERLPDW